MMQECSTDRFVIEGDSCPAPIINSFTPMSGKNAAREYCLPLSLTIMHSACIFHTYKHIECTVHVVYIAEVHVYPYIFVKHLK